MKNSTLATKLMMAAIFLTVLVYFGVNLAAYFTDPYTTTVAYAYTGERAVTVSGYVARSEEVLPGGGELVYSARGEGERVSAGGTVALIYQSVQALEEANTLRSLEEQLEQLLYARTLASGNQTSARLDEEVAGALVRFRQGLSRGGQSAVGQTAAGETAASLRSAVLKRSYAYSGTGSLETSIASLQEQISNLSAVADPNTTRVTAPRAGLFSSLVDGYETVLTPEAISQMTPSAYRTLAPEEGAAGVGKLVYGLKWYFLTLMRTEDVGRMQVGDAITLRFQSGLDRDVDMRVDSISAEESGRRVVVFSSERNLGLTTLLRQQNAQIIFESYAGVRVPRSAVRVDNQPVLDEDDQPVLDSAGNPKTQSVTCVYCLWGNTARLKPVTVLWQEDEYILVAPDEEALSAFSTEQAREGRRLRAGDQVITAAADLYDGKGIR